MAITLKFNIGRQGHAGALDSFTKKGLYLMIQHFKYTIGKNLITAEQKMKEAPKQYLSFRSSHQSLIVLLSLFHNS